MDETGEFIDIRHLFIACPACEQYEIGSYPGAEWPYECLQCGWHGRALPEAVSDAESP